MNQNMLRRSIMSADISISDKDLFTGLAMKEFFNTFASGIIERRESDISIELEWNQNAPVAYATSRRLLYLNANNDFTKRKDRKTRFKIMKGLALHECGHLLWTDFKLFEEITDKLMNGNILYPDPKTAESEQMVEMLSKYPELKSLAVSFLHDIHNRIEDGFIEYALLALCGGYSRCLRYLRDLQSSRMDNWQEMATGGLGYWEILCNGILFYAKYRHKILETSDSSKEQELYFSLLDDIDAAVSEKDAFKRARLCNAVAARLFVYLFEEPTEESTDEDDKQSGGIISDGKPSEDENADSSSEKADSSGTSNGQNAGDGSGDNSSEKKQLQQPNDVLLSTDENDKQSGGIISDGKPSEDENADSSSEKADSSGTSNGQNAGDGSGDNSSEKKQLQQPNDVLLSRLEKQLRKQKEMDVDEGKRDIDEKVPMQNESALQSRISSPTLSSMKPDDESADSELEQVERDDKKRRQEEHVEKEIEKNLNQMLQDMPSRVPSTVKRAEPGDEKTYLELKARLAPVVKRLISELLREIEDKRDGQKVNRLYTGNQFDVSGFCQRDGKAFSRNIMPEDFPDMSIMVLVDLSGSMGGKKLKTAMDTAYVLYSFCTALHIPVSVYGHNVLGDRVSLASFAEFDSIDRRDSRRITSMYAAGYNRDGYALRFCSAHLANRGSDTKIFFIISDGRPSAYSSEDAAMEDMRKVLVEYGKKGIVYIAAGIAEDNSKIKRYYTDDPSVKGTSKDTCPVHLGRKYSAHFLDVTEIERLPKQFVKIVKNRLEKEM